MMNINTLALALASTIIYKISNNKVYLKAETSKPLHLIKITITIKKKKKMPQVKIKVNVKIIVILNQIT